LRELRGDGSKPLLLLRHTEKPVDKKLANLVCRSFSNEKVQLASQWFRCVKVGDEVLDASHPLNALFSAPNSPRVILSTSQGTRVIRALGKNTDSLDWQDLTAILRADYKKSPDAHVKALQKVLVDLDKLDERHKKTSRELQKAEDRTIISRSRRLRIKLNKIEKDFKRTLTREQKYKNLVPRLPAQETKKPVKRT
jgi:hypothetical protein